MPKRAPRLQTFAEKFNTWVGNRFGWNQRRNFVLGHTDKRREELLATLHEFLLAEKVDVKIWHLWWDESIGLFCIGRNEFGFHLDGELNRDGWHCICTFHILHVLLEMTKPNNDILFVFFEYFDCTENIVRIWICIVTWKIKPFSICFALVLPAESSQKCTKESWEDRRIHFVTSEEGTLFDIDRRSLVRLSLNDDSESNVLKAFRTGAANRSERDIMNHVLVLEMFQRFSNTQTYLNKQTMSWCKDFLWGHMFLIAFVKVGRKMLTGDSASFCVKAWHTNKNIATWADISVLVCLVKVAELWEWLTWLRGRS